MKEIAKRVHALQGKPELMENNQSREDNVIHDGNAAQDCLKHLAEQTFPKDNWYALYTRHQHEKVIARHLSQMGFDIFLPLSHEVHQWKDRRKTIEVPLFPSYVFFSGDLTRLTEILNVPGVCWLVSSGGKVGIISPEEINLLRQAVASRLPIEPHPFLKCGERVRVHSGPLAGIEGMVMRRKGLTRLVLPVAMLCKSVSVEVDEASVERIPCA